MMSSTWLQRFASSLASETNVEQIGESLPVGSFEFLEPRYLLSQMAMPDLVDRDLILHHAGHDHDQPDESPQNQVGGNGVGEWLGSAITYSTSAAGVPLLHSLASAPVSIYLDFDGDVATGTDPYDTDGNPALFNATEQSVIVEAWRHISQYFAMFDVDVTTEFDARPKVWHVSGNNIVGGYSYVGQVPNSRPRSFNNSGDARTRQSGIAHELGHNFGLLHQSLFNSYGELTAEYRGRTDNLHGTIMGVDFDGIVKKWWLGHASNSPTTLQDDIAIIANVIKEYQGVGGDGMRADDFGNTIALATSLVSEGSVQYRNGIIERMNDVDTFSFSVTTAGVYTASLGMDLPSMLDGKLQIFDSAGNMLANADDVTNAQFTTLDLTAGTYYAMVSSHGNYSDLGSYELVVTPGLPTNWNSQDIGTVNLPGRTQYDASTGTFLMSASGSDISGTSDSFHYAYQQLTGDGSIIARVDSQSNTNSSARAGVMIRESTGSGAKHVSAFVTPTTGAMMRSRSTTGGSTANVNGTSTATAPYWVRLTRAGNVFTTFTSADGVSWTQMGQTTVSMASSVLIGLANSARNNSSNNFVKFSQVAVTGTLSNAVTPPTLNGLAAPSVVGLSNVTSSSATLDWTNVAGNTGYTVERSADGAVWSSIGTTGANVTTFVSSSLIAAHQYFYRIRTNSGLTVSTPSTVGTVTTRAAAVSNFTLMTINTSTIVVDWREVSGETGYRVERSIDGVNFSTVATVGANRPSYTNTGLQTDTAYHYRVVTLTSFGDAGVTAALSTRTRLAAPTGLSVASSSATQISLGWTSLGSGVAYLLERSTNGGTSFSTVATPAAGTTSYTDTSVSPFTSYVYRLRGVSGGINGLSAQASVITPGSPNPLPWTSRDIGSATVAGVSNFSGGVFSDFISSGDIWNSSDSFRYTSHPLLGDGSIIARVDQVTNTAGWAKAGVMIRETTAAGSKHVSMFVTPENGVAMQYRTSTNGGSSNVNTAGPVAPYWVRLTRAGNVFTGSSSTDGVNWVQVSQVTVTMNSLVEIGLAHTSNNRSLIGQASFSNVQATAAPAEIQVFDGSTEIVDGSGSVNFGTTLHNVPLTKTLTIKNLGEANLVVQPVMVPAGFSVLTNFAANQVIAGGGQATITVQLDATSVGANSGQLSFANNDNNENPFNFAMSGTVSAAPEIVVLDGPSDILDGLGSVDFGTTPLGTNVEKTFTINNNGSAVLTLSEPILTGAYSLVGVFPASIAAGGSATFVVRLTSSTLGTANGTISFANSDHDENPFSFSLTGAVSALSEVSIFDGTTNILDGTGSVSFGTTTIGTNVDKTFTINNTGTAALTLTAPTFTGAYSLVGAFPTSIAAGASASFTVRFTAATVGAANGTISFANNDGDENPFNFALTGTVNPISYTPVIIDDGDAGHALAGLWTPTASGFNGDIRYATNTGGVKTSSWTFAGVPQGQYAVRATWVNANGRATNANYQVSNGVGGSLAGNVLINQAVAPTGLTLGGRVFQEIAVVNITNGAAVVTLTNVGANGFVIADAVRLERLGDIPAIEIEVLDGTTSIADNTGSVSLGSSTLNGPVLTKTFTVKNKGSQNLTLQPITLTGTAFTLVSPNFAAGQLVGPDQTVTFTIQMATGALGNYSGTVSFGNNDSDENPFNFAITGTVSPVAIVDDGDAGFSTSGVWSPTTGGRGNDVRYATNTGGIKTATWTSVGTPGQYRISASWLAANGRATNAAYSVFNGTGGPLLGTTFVNQAVAPNDRTDAGTAFEDLGVFNIASGTVVVQLSNVGANGVVIADAIRFERLGDLVDGPEIEVFDGVVGIHDNGGSASIGQAFQNAAPISKTFTIRNSGTQNLTLQPISVTGAAFTLTSANFTPGQILAPNATVTFTVQLSTATLGAFSGTVSFGNSDGDENPFNFAITGTVGTTAILDNGTAGFATAGLWSPAAGGRGNSILYATNAGGLKTATWTFANITSGQYGVSAAWTSANGRASNAPFTVFNGIGGTSLGTVTVNQLIAPNDRTDTGTAFEDLGVFDMTGSSLVVQLANTGATGFVIADAIRIERIGGLPVAFEVAVGTPLATETKSLRPSAPLLVANTARPAVASSAAHSPTGAALQLVSVNAAAETPAAVTADALDGFFGEAGAWGLLMG